MKIFYSQRTDTLSLVLRDNVKVLQSGEDKPGVILDYDKDGNLVSLEILDASRRVTDAREGEKGSGSFVAWALVESNRKLIEIFEAKIKVKLDEIWGAV